MKIIFMGTPDLAASVLKTMLEAGLEVSLAVTQPDRQKGRGKSLWINVFSDCICWCSCIKHKGIFFI